MFERMSESLVVDPGADEAVLLGRITELERVKAAAAAQQADRGGARGWAAGVARRVGLGDRVGPAGVPASG